MLDEFRSTLITWDKATSRIYSPVTANASDENGRKLVVQIVNGGQVEDLTGATLHLYWETRDKLHDGLDVFKVVDLKKGEFELSYTTGMLSNKGVLNANLVLIDTVGRVVSERFKITVTEGIDDDAIQSENSFSSLTQALIDISNLEQNYAPRLNDLTAQLQQTEQSLNAQLAQSAMENKNIQQSKRRPLVTFVTDDGKKEDWTKLKPLSETYNVPFTAGIIAGASSPTYLTHEQILYLQDELGWEIASRTVNHVAMATLTTEEQIELECKQSKDSLTKLGYKVKNMVYPYGSHDERVRRITKKYYNCATSVSVGLLNTGIVSSFMLNRYALGDSAVEGKNTSAYYKSLVDNAIASNAWLIFMLNPGTAKHDATQQLYLEQTIQYIQSKNVDIVNLQEGYDVFGNSFEAGDYTGSSVGVAVSKDGQTANFPNNFQIIPKTGINNATPVTAFPKGVVSSTTITSVDAAGFPTSGGTLITFRLNNSDDYSFQLWTHIQSHLLYKRTCAAGVWQAWDYYISNTQMNTAIANSQTNEIKTVANAYTSSQPITAYPNNKITTHYYNAAGQTGWPAPTAGIVTTYRIGGDGCHRQEVRGYNSNSIWARHVTSAGVWSDWQKISAV